MPTSLAAADLVVARAGATTVAEIAVLGLPSVLVPLPIATDDHQTANARGLVDLGAALRLANRRAEARDPLREALDMARRDGALAIARRAHEELETTGEKLRPLLTGGVESLTPSERRVASMAAEGKTNRAIAQDLFLTVKTIEAHLSSAYRKLDIDSRSELPETLSVNESGDATAFSPGMMH